MKTYFRLFEECYLVRKDLCSVIYNTFSGAVYIISPEESRLITNLENNISIRESVNNANMDYLFAMEKLKLYEENGLGMYFDEPIYINKVAPDYSFFEHTFFKIPPTINRAIISITNICDSKCYHCNSDKYLNVLQCLTCVGKEKKIKFEQMDYSTVKIALDNLKKLNCDNVILKIPSMQDNPYQFDEVFKLLQSLKFKNVQTLIGSGIHVGTALTLHKNKIFPIFQEVIETEEDVENILSKVKSLSENGIRSNMMLIILMDINLNMDSILSRLNEIPKHIKVHIDYILEKTKTQNEYFSSQFNYIKQIPTVDIRSYALNSVYNSCLYGTIYINQEGDIFPCPGLTDFNLGNVRDFSKIFDKEADINIQYFWKLNNSKISKCKDCGLQFACVDCRSFEYQLTKDIAEKALCQKFV